MSLPPNFMLEDIAGTLRAICIFPLFVVAPGYAIAWLCDFFDFRRRTGAFRLALAIPLSIAVCPIVTYLAGRFGSLTAVWLFYWAAALAFAACFRFSTRRRSLSDLRLAGVCVAIWLAICVLSSIDLQIGSRVYYPTSALDNSVRTAFVHSISTTGIPPQTPFFLPEHPAPLRYHYFWLMICSLVERVGAPHVTPRQALIGGTFWCGLALIALVALYLKLFMGFDDPAAFRRRFRTALLLLCITGLDIIPTLFLVMLYAKGALPFLLPSVEWWNEHVDWFVYTALWAPHAISSLLACLTAFLLLWKLPETSGRAGLLRYSLVAGAALASSIGASIYVSFVFAVFLIAWTAIVLWKRWRRELAGLLIAGTACVALALPYLTGLRGPAAAPEGSPLQFTVRAFSFAALVPSWRGMSAFWRLALVNGPLIPLNYLLELGLFFLVGVIQWRRGRGRALSRRELACWVMAGTSILICTFVRSSVIGCNDLGWRGFLVAQFVLLLWAADVLADRSRLSERAASLLTICFALGLAGTVYDLTLTRLYPVLSDRGVVPPLDWMSPDRHLGERTYALRTAYQWAHGATAESAAIQFNPKVVFQDTPAMLYGDRRFVAADLRCNVTFGGRPELCAPVVERLQQFYPASGNSAPASLRDVCANLPVDVLVAKDTDPVWRDRRSWVWAERPAFENAYVRLFRCAAAPLTTARSR